MFLLVAVLFTACRSSHEEVEEHQDDCFLDIYVYAPGRPIVTRGDVGEVEQRAEAESKIHMLQIWVFKHADQQLVGYIGAGADDQSAVPDPTILNETGQQTYRMKVAKEFADYPEPVDVYVVANAASCGLSLGKNTTIAQLNEAVIGTNYFGTTDLYDKDDLELPDGRIAKYGLPMSAFVEDQPVTGLFPSLRIGSVEEMTILEPTRAVSKLRFVLCQIANQSESKKLVSIDDIELNGNIIPKASWLMPRENSNYTEFSTEAIKYGSLTPEAIPAVVDPLVYAYETQTAQEYEDMINTAIGEGKLKELGLTYLRESDKQLTGTIHYKYSENGTEKTDVANFAIAAPGDFLRNHSWIIYVYYMDSKIHILTVTYIGMKKWIEDGADESITVYNW